MADLAELLEQLRRGAAPPLDVDQVDALVGWLLGKSDGETLPRPDHDPVLQQLVFYRLDAVLFSGGALRLQPAGLGPGEPDDLRRTRFRRLAGAFHPDRHPGLADWLTERSQAVLQAYSRFKQGDEPAPKVVVPPAGPYPGYAPPRTPRRGPFRNARARWAAPLARLRRRFGNDRWLPHKLIGGLALLALLPVLNLLLVPDPVPGRAASTERESGQRAERPIEAGSRSAAAPVAAPIAASASEQADLAEVASTTAGTASSPEPESDSALLEAARQAMRLDDPPAEPLPTVDEQLAAMGLDSDSECLYRRIRGESRPPRRAAPTEPDSGGPTAAAVAAAGVPTAGASTSQTSENASGPAGITDGRAGTEAGAGARSDRGAPGDAIAMTAPTTVAETGSNAATARLIEPAQEPGDAEPGQTTAIASTPQPALAPADLTLGLIASQPAGALLRGYAKDLEAGNLISLLGRFESRARHGRARGTDAIAAHYRTLFDRHAPRRVVLRVLRVESLERGLRIEAELRIEGLRDGRIVTGRDGRAVFVLDGQPLRIGRLDW